MFTKDAQPCKYYMKLFPSKPLYFICTVSFLTKGLISHSTLKIFQKCVYLMYQKRIFVYENIHFELVFIIQLCSSSGTFDISLNKSWQKEKFLTLIIMKIVKSKDRNIDLLNQKFSTIKELKLIKTLKKMSILDIKMT